jgi:hypothetical protein
VIESDQRRGSSGAAVLGALLIALGLVFLAGNYWNVDVGQYGWPIYVIGPGLAVVLLGLTQRNGSGLTIFGSMLAIIGLILLYQNLTDRWESWAYAWTLVAPGGSGVGMLVYGARAANGGMMRAGLWQIFTALGLFAAGFLFFEALIGISGRHFPLPDWVLPAAVIALGLLLLIRGFTARRDVHFGESDEPSWPSRRENEPKPAEDEQKA